MAESLMGIFVVALILGTGYALGYMRGEERATMLSIKAGWERDARAWEERHARRMRELGVEVDE